MMTEQRTAELLAICEENNRTYAAWLAKERAALNGTGERGGYWTGRQAGRGMACVESEVFVIVTKAGADRSSQMVVRTRCAAGVRADDLATAFCERRGHKVHDISAIMPKGYTAHMNGVR